MDEFIEFLTSSEMIIVGIIAAIGSFLGLIVYILDKTYYKRKQRHNTKELNNLVEDVSKVIEEEQAIESTAIPIPEVSTPTVSMEVEEQPKITTIEEALSVAENIEQKDSVVVVNEVSNEDKKEEEIQPIEEISDDNQINSIENEVYENVVNEIEEKPLVIPIEEYESSKSIQDIYSELKEEVEKNGEILEPVGELKYTDIEPNKEEAIAQLKKVTEDLIKKEEEKNNLIENIELTKFEAEQEENAIISMEELLKKGNEIYAKNEVKQYEDEGNEPISIQDLELRMNNIKEEIKSIDNDEQIEVIDAPSDNLEKLESESSNKVVLDDFNTIGKSDKIYRDDIVFRSSPIISPIFGIEEVSTSNDMMLENTANYDKFDAEIKKTNEFIVTLKELQEKLD